MRVIRTRRGARIVQGRSVLSEILSEPGPTHSVFDVLAAVAAGHSPRARVAMLGFAAGGMIAPMRALGSEASVRAVDLDLSMVPLFDELCGDYAGDVRITRADAAKWLRAQKKKFDVIIEDLSIEEREDVTKPKVSFETLPPLIKSKLSANGVAVVNVLPLAGWSWRDLNRTLLHPWKGRGVQIVFTEYVNRFVIVGRDVGTPARVSRELKTALRSIGSEIAEKFRVYRLS